VNGNVVSGRCHLNASTVFKSIAGPNVKIIVLRRSEGVEDMAVKPLTQFPVTLEDEVSLANGYTHREMSGIKHRLCIP